MAVVAVPATTVLYEPPPSIAVQVARFSVAPFPAGFRQVMAMLRLAEVIHRLLIAGAAMVGALSSGGAASPLAVTANELCSEA